jgi:tetratricopeptide (TPR) repeat protein
MKHASLIFITICLMGAMLGAQVKPPRTLQDAFQLEQKGQFEAAVNAITHVLDSTQLNDSSQLNQTELGRAYIMLGFAYRGEGKFTSAEKSLDRAIDILKRDPADAGDYASALEHYAALYGDLGDLNAAASMLHKALHLRQQTGDYASTARTLLNLAETALARKQLHEAEEYVKQAAAAMKLAPDLVVDDRMAFLETQALLQMREGHASAAIAGFTSALELCTATLGEQHWLAGWEHVLRGKAYLEAGDMSRALADMQQGLAILEPALGPRSPTYIASQLVYSQALAQSGSYIEAAQWKAAAEQTRKDLYGGQCTGCTINVAGFR